MVPRMRQERNRRGGERVKIIFTVASVAMGRVWDVALRRQPTGLVLWHVFEPETRSSICGGAISVGQPVEREPVDTNDQRCVGMEVDSPTGGYLLPLIQRLCVRGRKLDEMIFG